MKKYQLSIADIIFEIVGPTELNFKQNLIPFLNNDMLKRHADIRIEIFHGTEHIVMDENWEEVAGGIFLGVNGFIQRYQWKRNEYIYRLEQFGRGLPCQIGIPYSFVDTFYQNGDLLRYLALDRLLIKWNRFFLHSALVFYKGEMFLFAAPSGGGKTTHASLWEKHYNAEIINGDKALLYEKEGVWYAAGSPIAGSSDLYKNKKAPIKAIVFLEKGNTNCIRTLSFKEAYLHLYSELIKSKWDKNYNYKILDVAEQIAKTVSVWKLTCRPEKNAVDCVLRYAEGEQNAEKMGS